MYLKLKKLIECKLMYSIGLLFKLSLSLTLNDKCFKNISWKKFFKFGLKTESNISFVHPTAEKYCKAKLTTFSVGWSLEISIVFTDCKYFSCMTWETFKKSLECLFLKYSAIALTSAGSLFDDELAVEKYMKYFKII